MIASLKRDLEISLETALLLAEETTTLNELASRVYDSEPALMEQLRRPWMVERLRWLLARKRQRIKPDNQLPLPGFEHLPRRLTMKDGSRTPLRQAQITDLREFKDVHIKRAERNDHRLRELDALIELMGPYVKTSPGIRVIEVMDKEKAKQEATAHS